MNRYTVKAALALASVLALGLSHAAGFPIHTGASQAAPGTIARTQWHGTPFVNPHCLKPSWPRGCPWRRHPRRSLAWPGVPPACVYPYLGVCDPASYYSPYWTGPDGIFWYWYGY